jgi:hypothetical protein
MRGILTTVIVLLAASAMASAAATVTWMDIDDYGPGVTQGATVFPSLLDDPATLIFDNSAVLPFSTDVTSTGSAGISWVNFPLQNSNVAIHTLGRSGYDWSAPNGQGALAPATLAIDDGATVPFFTNTKGSDSDPQAQYQFPYNIPRPQASCQNWYTSVYFNLSRTATQFGVYLPTGSNWPYNIDPNTKLPYDDSNYNLVLQRNIYVGVLGPNDTLATATFTAVPLGGFCPFVMVSDPAGGIKGVVIMDDINGSSATIGFMDPYATLTGTLPPLYIHAHDGDSNNDGKVDVVDLGVLAKWYDSTGLATSAVDPFGAGSWQKADFSGDGKVDVVDLGILAKNYDWVGSPAVPTPEPLTLSLLATGALALIRRGK